MVSSLTHFQHGGGRRKTAENNRKKQETAEDSGGRHGKAGDGRRLWGDGPSLRCVGQVPENTGRDDRMPSVLVFASYVSGNFRK